MSIVDGWWIAARCCIIPLAVHESPAAGRCRLGRGASIMRKRHLEQVCAILLAASSGAAYAQGAEQSGYQVKNTTGETVACGIRKAGSSAIEKISLRPGQDWSRTYNGAGDRKFMCKGADPRLANFAAQWVPINSGEAHVLVKNKIGRVVLRQASK